MKKILFITLMTTSLLAVSSAKAYTTYGEIKSCGSFVSEMQKNSQQYQIDRAYIAGFLTGAGYVSNKSNSVDHAGVEKWVENYCEKNPLKDLLDALETLAIKLKTM